MILQLASGTRGAIIETAARIIGTAVLAGFLAAAVALLYRWYVRERVPVGLALLVGLSGVALVAGTTSLLAQELAPGGEGPTVLAALLNVVTFLVGGLGAYSGLRIGDALGVDLFAATGGDGIEGEVSQLVKAVGRVISVEIPDEIDDIVGYDPVPEATKETLAGRTFLFPRRLTRSELRERFVSRLKTDYGVGHVDVEFDESGGIEYLALGSRAAGIGPTLPPATNAVAIRADPAHAAQSGDLVQVWETDPPQRVLTGELRGVAGEIVTVAIDAGDTPKLDPTVQYKLVTLPVQDRPDREFASLLRAADETLATITVQPGSPADGATVESIGATVAAITREDEQPTPLPARDRTLRAGDVIYAIATPDTLRKVETMTRAPDGVADTGSAGLPADEAVAPEGEPSEERPTDDTEETATTESTPVDGTEGDSEKPDAGDTRPEDQQADSSATEAEDTARSSAEQTDAGEPSDDETTVPSGSAFPDSDDLPGLDVGGEDDERGDEPSDERASEGDEEPEVPDSAAFPDTDDLPGADVEDREDAETDEESTDGETESEETDADSEDEDTTGFGDLIEESQSADEGLDDLLDDDDDEDRDT